jgi:uncharacterized membrane protein
LWAMIHFFCLSWKDKIQNNILLLLCKTFHATIAWCCAVYYLCKLFSNNNDHG